MPWGPNDAKRHTRKARSANERRRWAQIANNVLSKTGNEAAAIKIANGIIAREMRKRGGS